MDVEAPLTLFFCFIFLQSMTTYTAAVSPLDSEYCEVSKLTRKVVVPCPADKESWTKAAVKFNCSQHQGKCSSALEYHCLINPWQNVTVEVCAPSTIIRSGHCAEYNARGGKIQEFYIPNCRACTRDYMSTEAYKYQECYYQVYQQNEKLNVLQRKGNETKTHQEHHDHQEQLQPRAAAFGDVGDGSRVRSSKFINLCVFFMGIKTVF